MKKTALIAVVIGFGFILFGFLARSPGQTSISSAVIATGVFIIIFAAVLTVVLYFRSLDGGGRDS